MFYQENQISEKLKCSDCKNILKEPKCLFYLSSHLCVRSFFSLENLELDFDITLHY